MSYKLKSGQCVSAVQLSASWAAPCLQLHVSMSACCHDSCHYDNGLNLLNAKPAFIN